MFLLHSLECHLVFKENQMAFMEHENVYECFAMSTLINQSVCVYNVYTKENVISVYVQHMNALVINL